MLLIIKCWDAERNTAASEPKSKDAAKQADEPCKCPLGLFDMSHASFSARIASDINWMVWPIVRIGWRPSLLDILHNYDFTLRLLVLNWISILINHNRLRRHRRLSLHRRWLTLHRRWLTLHRKWLTLHRRWLTLHRRWLSLRNWRIRLRLRIRLSHHWSQLLGRITHFMYQSNN